MKPCACCSGKLFSNCCSPFLSGKALPKTVKQLMRSRYAAFALGGYGQYLLDTWHPDSRPVVTADDLGSVDSNWLGLDIMDATQQGDSGTVEFCARFLDEQGRPQNHRENSRFVRIKGRWYYLNALSLAVQNTGIAL
jgi:SEC-C motif domain protein